MHVCGPFFRHDRSQVGNCFGCAMPTGRHAIVIVNITHIVPSLLGPLSGLGLINQVKDGVILTKERMKDSLRLK
jgi:hypothetical protein